MTTFYDFISNLGFWQWCGLLLLVVVSGDAFASMIRAARRKG